MATETAPEQRKEAMGMFIKGTCNGFRSYTRKGSGELVTQLLVNLPGATSSIQVEIPYGTDLSKFKDLEPCALKIIPIFYQGRIMGFNLA
nr:hypothetical protein [uncultured Desulfobulbus sp.]